MDLKVALLQLVPGKTQEENLKIINVLPMITRIPYPVLLGCSRKSVIGNVLNVPVSERL